MVNRTILRIGLILSIFLTGAGEPAASTNPTVRGGAIDEETGKPIPVFKARTLVKTGTTAVTILRKGTDGKFEAPLPISGESYTIQIEADGYILAESGPLVPKDGILEFSARMKKGNLYAGNVLLPDGKPAAGAIIALKDPRRSFSMDNGRLRTDIDSDMVMVKTNAAGRYGLPQQKGAAQGLILHDTGWAEVAFDGVAGPGDATLRKWCTVEGKFVRDGKPLPNQSVMLMVTTTRVRGGEIPLRAYFSNYHAKTDAEGKFSFDRVVDGKVDVCIVVSPSNRILTVQSLDLQPGERRTLQDLDPPAAPPAPPPPARPVPEGLP